MSNDEKSKKIFGTMTNERRPGETKKSGENPPAPVDLRPEPPPAPPAPPAQDESEKK